MVYFRIIIPNYNNSNWLDKCIGSVVGQTFTDYGLVFVDDASTDGSASKAIDLIGTKGYVIPLGDKHWNGGSRNIGLENYLDSKYTLFLDSDDWFVDCDVLQNLHDFIATKGSPDCIRLPYRFEYDGNKAGQVPLCDKSPAELAKSIFVACWTKCIKSELVQPFPENTLMEDVIQHIKQCDVINDCVPYNKFVVLHNRNNTNSCTRKENVDGNKKWRSSMYRYMADLLDMELVHGYCEKVRQSRVDGCLDNIKKGVYSQSGIK